jgi:hypothetical protein
MPGTERVRPAETREMRLISRLIEMSSEVSDTSLAQFIARRRHPEAGPNSWNEISHALTPVIFGEFVTEGTIRKWAAAYGIPDRGPRIKITTREYASGLKAAGISL